MESPNLTITFLIEYDKKFLLVSRHKNEEHFPSLWAFPGGKSEIGETAIQTIRREVLEETGLELSDEVVFLDSYQFKKSVGIAFLVRAKSDRVRLGEELNEYRWVSSLEEMKEYRCIPGIYNHLQRALEAMRKGVFDSLEGMNLVEEKYINQE